MEESSVYRFSSDWIYKLEHPIHWVYYWNQADLVRSIASADDVILEIGVGTRFLSHYLKSRGLQVTTLDIDAEKKPDIVANVVEADLPASYDYILAFEVFEHIPFEDFKKVLTRLRPKCRKGMIISIPRNEKQWLKLNLILPGARNHEFRLARKRGKIITATHHWEIDFPPYSKKMVEQTLEQHGFLVKQRRKVDSLLFYVLEPKS